MTTLKLTQAEAIESIKRRLTNAELDERKGLMILTGYNTNNMPVLCIWTPKSIKPVLHYYYRSEQQLINAACNFITNHQTRQKEIADKKASEKGFEVTNVLSVDDILYESWGWEQTNVSFYQIVKIKSRTQIIVKQVCCISKDHVSQGMADYVDPDKDNFIGDDLVINVRASGCSGGFTAKAGRQYLYKYDGKSKYRSWYA